MKKTVEQVYDAPAKPHMVGDGFRVFNLIPGTCISQERMSPFLLLDFNPEFDFGRSEKPRGVGVHPHKGFETVTISYKGSVEHHDSMGNSGIIHPGDVQWMTAGAGILHKEFHEEQFSRKGGPFEMVQLWVNLNASNKTVPAHYQAIKAGQMGKVSIENGGGTVNVIAGSFEQVKGPASTYSPVNLFDVRIKKGSFLNVHIPASHNTAMLVIEGNVLVNDRRAPVHSFVLFRNDGEDILLNAHQDSVILLLSGEPIHEPIVSYGPFVMNTEQEIDTAIQEFRSGKYGTLD